MKATFVLVVYSFLAVFLKPSCFFAAPLDSNSGKLNNSNNSENQTNAENFCYSNQCILAASSMYNSIDSSANPCDDFYQYACGGWERKNLMLNGYEEWNSLNFLDYENKLLIKSQLEQSNDSSNVTEAETKARAFYRSCMDPFGTIEKLGSYPLMNILNQLVFMSNDSKIVINETLANLLTLVQIGYDRNALFTLEIFDDPMNSSFFNIRIMQGSLIFISNASDESDTNSIQKVYLKNTLSSLFGNISNLDVEIDNIFGLEKDLNKIMVPMEDLSNKKRSLIRVKVGNLSQSTNASFFDWTSFFNNFLSTYNSSETLNDTDEILVRGAIYFAKLNQLVTDYQATGRENIIKLWLILRLVEFGLPLLSEKFRLESNLNRWQTCLQQMRSSQPSDLDHAITRMFLRASPNSDKLTAANMIKSIKQAFVDNLSKVSWINDATRRLVQDKVDYIQDLIGYPEFVTNDTLLNARCQSLVIEESDFFGNAVRLVRSSLKSKASLFRTRVDRESWILSPSTANAMYVLTRNQIIFPAGILQPPFFHPNNPMSINYGTMGSVIGHELTHGFDNEGREYDKTGTTKQWWDDATIERFTNEVSKCMIDQYSKFKINDDYVNGKQTLAENIADNGGLQMSFNAYKKWTEENGEERPLPILGLTNYQSLFVSFAQLWCSKSSDNVNRYLLLNDEHSPDRFRVVGTLSNLDEFAKAFNCPLGSPMNPANKCKVW